MDVRERQTERQTQIEEYVDKEKEKETQPNNIEKQNRKTITTRSL
jgi:hypothetical protein